MAVIIDQVNVDPDVSRSAPETPAASAEAPTAPLALDPEELRRALRRWIERQMRIRSD